MSLEHPPSLEELQRYLDPDPPPPKLGAAQLLAEWWGSSDDVNQDVKTLTLRKHFGGKEAIPRWDELSPDDRALFEGEGYTPEDFKTARTSPLREYAPMDEWTAQFAPMAEELVDAKREREALDPDAGNEQEEGDDERR